MICRWSIHCKACWLKGVRPGWKRFRAVWAELWPHDRPLIVQTLSRHTASAAHFQGLSESCGEMGQGPSFGSIKY